jgi:hypothetical protein
LKVTEKKRLKSGEQLPNSLETGRSEALRRKKPRRVSQRRELTVVTLGAVAAISGLGGFLAANPPAWAIAQENAAKQQASAQIVAGQATTGQEAIRKATAQEAAERKAIAEQTAREAAAEQ